MGRRRNKLNRRQEKQRKTHAANFHRKSRERARKTAAIAPKLD